MIEVIEIIKKLKTLREARHVTLEQIAKATNGSLVIFKRIDNCDNLNSISKIYLRAHLINYAEYLHAQDLKAKIDEVLPPLKSGVAPVTKKINPHQESLSNDKPTIHITPTASIPHNYKKVNYLPLVKFFLLSALACFILFKAAVFTAQKYTEIKQVWKIKKPKPEKQSPNKRVAVPVKTPVKPAVNNVIQRPTPPPPQVTTTPIESVSVANSVSASPAPVSAVKSRPTVSVITRNNVFIQVKIDGAVVFKSVLLKGVQEQWNGNSKIEIKISDPSQTILEILGKPVPTKNSRNPLTYVITPKGFTTQK